MALALAFVQVVITLAAFLFVWNYFKNKKDPRFPPGPPALPLIGNLLQFGNKPQAKIIEWANKYGPIYSIKMGTDDTIVLNDYKLIKEVFNESVGSGRTPSPIFLAFGGGNYGVVMSEGAHWEAQRRFTLRKLRDFGFAKASMEGLIMEEVSSMLKWFEKRLDETILCDRIFNGPVVNSLWNIVSGERTEWDAPTPPKILQIAEAIASAFNRMNGTGLTFAPALRYLAPEFFGWNKWITAIGDVVKTTGESVQRHLREIDWNNPQDFIDHYLVEKQKAIDPSSSFYRETGDKNLQALIPDLFLAGSETTSHTLSWSLLLLANNPSVQKKLQDELDTVIGQSRSPSVADLPNLPYTEALMNEVLRRSSILNVGVPHRMTEDTVIQGYFFPKNCTILSNIYTCNHDPKVWGDPDNFRPERFLSPDGKKYIKNEYLIPFSIGKRQCLGESLARQTLFLFITNIFQKFSVKMDPNDSGEAIRNIIPSDKMLNMPDPFKIIVSTR